MAALVLPLVFLLGGIFLGATPPALAQGPPGGGVTLVDPGLPLDLLNPEERARVESILNRAAFSHSVRGITYRSRPEILEFLLDHLDFASAILRTLNLGRYRIERRGTNFWGDDGDGTTGTFTLLFSDQRRRLYLARIQYSKPLLPRIEGQVLILLEYDHLTDGNGDPVVDQQVLGYAVPETPLTDSLTHLITVISPSAVQSAVTKKVRRLFRRVATITRLATDDPEGLVERLARSPEVPAQRLQAFRELLLAPRLPDWASTENPPRLLDSSRLTLPADPD